MVSFRSNVVAVVAAVTIAAVPNTAAGQSVLLRTPNLSGGWLGERGTLQFNFVHRFTVSDPPQRNVDNSPTFLLSYRLPFPVVIGVNYATASDVVITPPMPNEWEVFARYARFGGALQVGYNQAARSLDAELTMGRTMGPVRLLAVGRYLSNGYGSDTTRYAIGGGAVVRATRSVALALDYATLLDQRGLETAVWGAGLHLAIPHSPHTLSLQVTNTSTATLQGQSRGRDAFRGGFEFTVPFTLSRYFGKRRATAGAGGVGADTINGTAVEMRGMAFAPRRLGTSAGATVEFTNRDQIAHTVTADDGSWDSGPIEPGGTWRRTFDTPGTFTFHCSPHPFMTGTVVVK